MHSRKRIKKINKAKYKLLLAMCNKINKASARLTKKLQKTLLKSVMKDETYY